MNDQIDFKILTKNDIPDIALLAQQLHPDSTLQKLKTDLSQMFEFETYMCFGVVLNGKLVGISSGWTTVKLYSGKQLEVDNVVIAGPLRSNGLGKKFFKFIEDWAKKRDYKTIELNTYVQNSKSHKFYYNLGFSILGFHFWKQI